jgi:hypothetical protein
MKMEKTNTEINWRDMKWWSLIVSSVLMFIFWLICLVVSESIVTVGWVIFAFPTIVYFLYKKRIEAKKYGEFIWVLLLVLLFASVRYKELAYTSYRYGGFEDAFIAILISFIFLALPAIAFDAYIIHIRKELHCPNCGKIIKADWKICPYCRIQIREKELTCPHCGRPIKETIDYSNPKCPYCKKDISEVIRHVYE